MLLRKHFQADVPRTEEDARRYTIDTILGQYNCMRYINTRSQLTYGSERTLFIDSVRGTSTAHSTGTKTKLKSGCNSSFATASRILFNRVAR